MTCFGAIRQLSSAVLFVAATACVTPADPGDTSVDLRGTWQYSGQQTSGEQLTYDGTLSITARTGPAFGGSITVEERNSRGALRTIAGVLGGTVYSNGVIDIDVAIDAATLRHVGTLTADTLRGNWTTSDGLRSGSFRAIRTQP